MPPHYVLTLSDVSKSFGDKTVLKNIGLSFYYGAKIGVVGENGSGKSTLLRIMAGLDQDIHGEVQLTRGIRVGLVPQEPQLDTAKTVRENLMEAVAPIQKLLDRYNEVSARMGEPITDGEMDKLMAEMGELQEKIDACGGWEIDRLMDIASDALVLPPDDTPAAVLSGGERRRVSLCQALLEKPDLLLLDEPTNHLDAETVAWLETQLREYPGTVVIVTHDRYFLDHVTKWILELEGGRGLPFEGNYSSWLDQKIAMLAMIEKRQTERQKTLMREREWIRLSSERKADCHAHIDDYEKLAAVRFDPGAGDTVIKIAPGPRLGDKVLTASGVSKGYGGVSLIAGVSFDLPRGAMVGVIGPNGAGKTTLFRMILGQEAPDSGSLELGPSVVLSYVDQHRDALSDDKTVFEEITDGKDEIELGNVKMNSRAYVSRFNFRGTQQRKRVGECSGGERNRIHLAKMLRRGGNLLLLDEPTNDLDVNTMRVLEQALIDFPGCAMVISHDRFFLDRISTHLLIFEGNGKTRWFEGNFRAYEESLAADNPDRIAHRRSKYKRLTLR
ncbi:MAG: energy-dependent translational throttle protein EttA [Planctomycetota bacterium]|nr:energy-dependent translational throttle protein EttA [Planctomycetota bacterium]